MLVLNVWHDANRYRVDKSTVTIPDTRDDAGYTGCGVWAAQKPFCKGVEPKRSSGPCHALVSNTLVAEAGFSQHIAI